jgi:hypothetical protein
MKKLRIGIVDLVSRGPSGALFARVMNANLASITNDKHYSRCVRTLASVFIVVLAMAAASRSGNLVIFR